MIEILLKGHLDMVVGVRQNVYENAHRAGHGFGNRLFNFIYRTLFGPLFTDIFSGYRVFSKRFVKNFPAVSSGFEIETEMSVHASQLRTPIAEISTVYGSRQEGSVSILRTFRDGIRILFTFLILLRYLQNYFSKNCLFFRQFSEKMAIRLTCFSTSFFANRFGGDCTSFGAVFNFDVGSRPIVSFERHRAGLKNSI